MSMVLTCFSSLYLIYFQFQGLEGGIFFNVYQKGHMILRDRKREQAEEYGVKAIC